MPTIQLPNNWRPRKYQMPLWRYLEHGGKRAYEVAHRRWGKDDVCLHWAAVSAMERVGTYWHMLPEAAQARKAIWDAVNPNSGMRRIDEAFPKIIRETTRENDMFIRFKNGSSWQVLGSDNYNSFVGSPPIGVVFSEWALANPEAWSYVSPILRENGGWAMFITTPRGKNHAKNMLDMAKQSDSWFAEVSTVEQTGVFTQEALTEELKELISLYGTDIGEAKFNQEYKCDFSAPIIGSYYGREMNVAEADGRITTVPYNPSVAVHTAWDLGYGDSTAIWFFQVVGKEPRAIDYYEASGQGLDHYVKLINSKPYTYGTHVMPHDAGHGSLRTGMTLAKQVQEMGLKNVEVLPVNAVDPGIQLARQLIAQMWFDRVKCERGIEALRNYQRKWNEQMKVFSDTPVHNWASHGSDAWRYLAVWMATKYKSTLPKSPEPVTYNSYLTGSSNRWMG